MKKNTLYFKEKGVLASLTWKKS